MSLSPIKKQVLETLLDSGKPMRAIDVAKETGQKFQPVIMHLLWLVRNGYVSVPEKGLYLLTEKGKEALSMPEIITKEKAEVILAYSPHDKAFHFYANLGQPLNLHAHSLRDFANKVEKADLESVQFHMNRGDFEVWFNGLGDSELAKKVAALKEKNVIGEDMRKQLHELVEQRYMELAKLAGQPISDE